MSLSKNFKMMSLYNQRINSQLMAHCLTLPSETLEKDTHSFFPNIISYWNHILFGDLILMSRLASNNIANLSPLDLSAFPKPGSPQDLYHTNLLDIALLRTQVDALLIRYCDNLTEEDCDRFITYTTTEGVAITKAVADVTQHIFNHQTHHRGQLTCVLSQAGINYGCMDLPVIVAEGSR
ncbi:DinB family protein [Colwellia sp. Bg11-28]|uniref:DinB family protein n=1 Tax=Colwellia sp. Bg11-28 TaxID=2058305 RepID=UPI000C32930B|nr:DinB family protein [Colwellia sp. Bg11-28]PKH87193.1 damage-inducible protein DinB [Colwellia sp. Bg11-28]